MTIVKSVNSIVRLDCCANCVATSSKDSTILYVGGGTC